MFKYVCKRLLQSMVTLVIVATTVFLLLRLMPEEGYFAEGYDLSLIHISEPTRH